MTDPEIDEGIIDYLDREEWEYNRLWETDGQCLWNTFESISDELERRENEK